jgi:hypothetical protein
MFDGLNKHILVELAAYISTLEKSDFSDAKLEDLQMIISLLVFSVE